MTNINLELGTTPDGDAVSLPIEALRRHVVVLGSSGSGKTVLSKVLVEECVRKGLPVIAVDPQGDLASLALREDPSVLIRMGVDPKVAATFYDRVEPVLWTPGSSAGRSLSLLPRMTVPEGLNAEDRIRAYGAVAQSLAALVGDTSDVTPVGLSMILEYADAHGLACDSLADLQAFIADPPALLARELEPVFDGKARAKVCKSILVRTMGANRLLFGMGEPIDCDELFGLYDGPSEPIARGKVRLSIIYLNTLTSQEDKDLFVALLAGAMYQWMLGLDGSKQWGLFYMDEIAPYLPPVREPAAKKPLMLLLRQARKYGLSCLLATQSPGDLDYKAVGQMGTWALGRIQGERERGKVAPVLRAQPGLDTEAILEQLPGLPRGRFILINPDHFETATECQVRWLATQHRTVPIEEL